MNHPVEAVGHVAAGAALFSAWLGWLPPIAATVASILAAAWYLILIHDRVKKSG